MKPLVTTAALVLSLGFSALPVAATDDEFEACMAGSGGVTASMLECIGAANDRAQARLDDLLARQLPSLPPDQADLLEQAQEDWQAYRQSTCQAEALLWGDGSFASVAEAECWLELTTVRIEWLQDVSPDMTTELADAINAGDLPALEALLSGGANPNQIDSGGKTAVHRAAFAGNLLMLDAVLAHGGDPNALAQTGTTPLTDAVLARSHPVERIEKLLAAGADPNIADPNGGTPLHTAARTNNGEAILLLLHAGASPTAKTIGATFQTYYFSIPTAVLNDRALAERQEVIQWLRNNGIPLEAGAGAN